MGPSKGARREGNSLFQAVPQAIGRRPHLNGETQQNRCISLHNRGCPCSSNNRLGREWVGWSLAGSVAPQLAGL